MGVLPEQIRPHSVRVKTGSEGLLKSNYAKLLLSFGSGVVALIYEIVWFQLLELAIGSTAVSLGILLATFMGAMCLGSLIFPRQVEEGSWLGFLYGANIAGAVFGCLFSGLYLLRVYDAATATYVAVAVNMTVAGIALALGTTAAPRNADTRAELDPGRPLLVSRSGPRTPPPRWTCTPDRGAGQRRRSSIGDLMAT